MQTNYTIYHEFWMENRAVVKYERNLIKSIYIWIVSYTCECRNSSVKPNSKYAIQKNPINIIDKRKAIVICKQTILSWILNEEQSCCIVHLQLTYFLSIYHYYGFRHFPLKCTSRRSSLSHNVGVNSTIKYSMGSPLSPWFVYPRLQDGRLWHQAS